ncbi:hypothetical protein C7C46_00175 [Streptomyces tateyamensis]|uniref:Uncharacterized protein n=1 Tax=Streptomyces tateyamensis TaxID=565073 RepID=A0A2V4PBN4_9ACTN|nr:hypothetical protein C7C46_00175 [Streptomyces tateyamensis]
MAAVGNYLPGHPRWDAFFDLLVSTFEEEPKTVAVSVFGADVLLGRDLREFIRLTWLSAEASSAIAERARGAWQPEFLHWGTWPQLLIAPRTS